MSKDWSALRALLENMTGIDWESLEPGDWIWNARALVKATRTAIPELLDELDTLNKHVAHNDEEHATMKNVLRAEHKECKRLRAERSTLAARLAVLEHERDAYRSMVCDLLASAHPHPVEHPTMTRQWARARELLKNGPPALAAEENAK